MPIQSQVGNEQVKENTEVLEDVEDELPSQSQNQDQHGNKEQVDEELNELIAEEMKKMEEEKQSTEEAAQNTNQVNELDNIEKDFGDSSSNNNIIQGEEEKNPIDEIDDF